MTAKLIFLSEFDPNSDHLENTWNCPHISGLRAARTAGGWPPKRACGRSAGSCDRPEEPLATPVFILLVVVASSTSLVSAPDGRKLAHSAAPPLPSEPAPLGFAGDLISSSAKSPGWGEPSLQRGGDSGPNPVPIRWEGQGPCPSRDRATQRLTGGHAGLSCPRRRFATRCRSVVNSNSSSCRS